MILDRLDHADRYAGLHLGFARALKFLRQIEPAAIPLGRTEIDADRIYAVAARVAARSRAEARLEAHRRYIDIQYVISGVDGMGWRSRSECSQPVAEYDPQQDIEFFADPAAAWVDVHPGELIIFFPEDAHAPLVGSGDIHKIVVKVAIM